MDQYEELILEITALAVKANRFTNHHFFVGFSGHVNEFQVYYLENGYEEGSKNRVEILDVFINIEKNVLEKLEKCKQHIVALILSNKKRTS